MKQKCSPGQDVHSLMGSDELPQHRFSQDVVVHLSSCSQCEHSVNKVASHTHALCGANIIALLQLKADGEELTLNINSGGREQCAS